MIRQMLCHRKFGHMSDKGMLILSKQGLFGSRVTRKFRLYKPCIKGKQHKVKFNIGQHTSNEILEYVH